MTFVLVHGGGFGSSTWDRLLPHLCASALAVDLPGRGRRSADDLAAVATQECAEAIVAEMDASDIRDAVLVGHSLAGVTIPRVLDLVPDRVRAAVLISAIVPAHGENVMQTMDPSTRAAVEPALRQGIYSPGAGAGLEMLCNDLNEEQTSFVVRSRTDDSVRLLTDPMDLSGVEQAVPRWWVRLTKDQRVPPELQDECNTRWRGQVVTMPTGHMAMVADPAGLADLLNAIHERSSAPHE